MFLSAEKYTLSSERFFSEIFSHYITSHYDYRVGKHDKGLLPTHIGEKPGSKHPPLLVSAITNAGIPLFGLIQAKHSSPISE